MENIAALTTTAIAMTGESVSLVVNQLPDEIYEARLVNPDSGDTLTLAHDWDRYFVVTAPYVSKALAELDALCAEDNAKSFGWQEVTHG